MSDIHAVAQPGALVYGRDVDRNLDLVVAAAKRGSGLDAVIVTGDVADDGSGEAYRRVRRVLGSVGDVVLWVPGNHDQRDRMEEVDSDALASATCGAWRFVTVNSHWPGHVPGNVSDAELERLDAELGASKAGHCAVLVHHPPRTPCAHVDCQTIRRERVLEVLDGHAAVRLVLTGHLHRSFHITRRGVAWVGGPSTCMQVTHPDHSPTDEPPAANLIELGDDGAILVSTVLGITPPA